ncbi:hypothetical protein K501DRAFT_284316 [Backusella circina FSU 941]|nr:hypothetical protein K501DRAFT_284316 [Backusella circina FSU 941]
MYNDPSSQSGFNVKQEAQESSYSQAQYPKPNSTPKSDSPLGNTHTNFDNLTTRSYLDSTVVPTLLEGMRLLATERPSDPLAYLGRFLINKSKEENL